MTSKDYFDKGEALIKKFDETSDEELLQQALANYNTAIELQPGYAEAYHKRGMAYGYLDEFEKKFEDLATAIRIFKSLLRKDKENAELYYKLALVHSDNYNDKNNVKKAIKYFQKAINLGYVNSTVYFDMAQTYNQFFKMNLRKALEYYNKAIELDSNNADYYLARGDCYNDLNKPELALDDFNKGIELNPNDYIFYNRRGELYFRLREWDNAAVDYRLFRKLCQHSFKPEIKLLRNIHGGPFFEFYFSTDEDLINHEHWHTGSWFLEDCIFIAIDSAFPCTRKDYGYYCPHLLNKDDLSYSVNWLKNNLLELNSLKNFESYFEYIVKIRFVYTLIRHFDEYEEQWEEIIEKLKKTNEQLIELLSDAINKDHKLFLLGI